LLGVSFGLDPLPTMEAGVGREVLMTTVHPAAPEHAAQSLASNEIVPMLIGSTVGEIERELVLQTLARCDGNRTHAARILGLSVRTLRNKIRQYSAEGSDVPQSIRTRDDEISLSGDRKSRAASDEDCGDRSDAE
jgi:DNA-binding protein Fis